MVEHNGYMRRAIALARHGAGAVAPNPMVGAVLVQGDRVLAEGWHKQVGGPHAEVECLRTFGEGMVPADAVLHVSLEPCDHHGRTPPCTELLIARGVRHVVVPHADPHPGVSGRGIARLRAAGIDVTVGPCEAEARWTNRRFLTSVEQGRPYIVLKWAESADGFLDGGARDERGPFRITTPATDTLTHGWRAMEQAILVGARTVLHDDPALTVRHVAGPQPLRVVLDRGGITPAASRVYDGSVPTLLITGAPRAALPLVEQEMVPLDDDPVDHLLAALHRRSMRSLYVEGGATLLGAFIARGLWDEARVLSGSARLGSGTPAPVIAHAPLRTDASGTDGIAWIHNPAGHLPAPDPTWPW